MNSSIKNSPSKNSIFSDRRQLANRRGEHDLSMIGHNRRKQQERRRSMHAYAGESWWLQVNYFDGHYKIKSGTDISRAFDSLENLTRL